jgi:hypothetical protein
VSNVYEFVKRESDVEVPTNLKKTEKRGAQATGVSEMSVRRLVKDIKTTASEVSASFATLHKERLVSSLISTLGNFNGCVIRRTVNGFISLTNKGQR